MKLERVDRLSRERAFSPGLKRSWRTATNSSDTALVSMASEQAAAASSSGTSRTMPLRPSRPASFKSCSRNITPKFGVLRSLEMRGRSAKTSKHEMAASFLTGMVEEISSAFLMILLRFAPFSPGVDSQTIAPTKFSREGRSASARREATCAAVRR